MVTKTTSTKKIDNLVTQYIYAKDALENLEMDVMKMRYKILEHMVRNKLTEINVEPFTIEKVNVNKFAFNLGKLKTFLGATNFKLVTTIKVDPIAIKNYLSRNNINPKETNGAIMVTQDYRLLVKGNLPKGNKISI
jgi:hypothetical protein